MYNWENQLPGFVPPFLQYYSVAVKGYENARRVTDIQEDRQLTTPRTVLVSGDAGAV
jgi:hypothetical protein